MGKRGRPTKYQPEMVRQVNDYYFNQLKANNCPFIEDLALLLGVDDDTINEWCKRKKDFSAAIKKVKLLQKKWLKMAGLSGKSSATMAIFLLKANHGLTEKSVIEYQGIEEEPVNIVIRPAPLQPSNQSQYNTGPVDIGRQSLI